MTLPSPSLDDRRFQQLVDDAKRLVQERCPEWTDHNVSDPGITIIEAFAQMTDVLLYRLNQVPDRMYIKFLDLIGMKLFPPTPASTHLTFWLTAPAQVPITIPASTRVSTIRQADQPEITFSTTVSAEITPCSIQEIASHSSTGSIADRAEALRSRTIFPAFSTTPVSGDSLLIGLSAAVPSCVIRLRFYCNVEGVGIAPTNPPLIWEAWNGEIWQPCELERDDTGGLNVDGDVVLHVPNTHAFALINGKRAGWIRARVTPTIEHQPGYTSSPMILGAESGTVGATTHAIHGDIIENEFLGMSNGRAAQKFTASHSPVLNFENQTHIEIDTGDITSTWTYVENFADSSESDLHFTIDQSSGEISFGPTIRQLDGSLRQYGAIPPSDSVVRICSYATGGGKIGNITKGALRVLKSSIPFVASVENRSSAQGGIDGETMNQAKARGPIFLQTKNRAITVADFEELTQEIAPEIARVKCLPVSASTSPDVRVLIVPSSPYGSDCEIAFNDLIPSESVLEKIANHLDSVRLIGTRVLITPPKYQGITFVVSLRAKRTANVAAVQHNALIALNQYFNPITWNWGRHIQAGDAYAILQSLDEVDFVEDVRLFGANPVTGERGQETQRIIVEPGTLAYSYSHQVRVQ